MSNWSFRSHTTKDGRKIIYARSRQPIRQEDGSIAWRQVERSTGTGSIQAAREKVREFAAEYHAEASRPAPKGENLTFADAAEQYLLNGNGGRFLPPILERIGLRLCTDIDQSVMTELSLALYPAAKASTLNRQLFTPVCAVLNFVGLRPLLRRPKGHDKLRTIDKSELPDDEWFHAVLPYLTPAKRAVMLLCTLHGCRIGETLERTPDDLDQKRWTLSVPDSKNGTPFQIQLSEPVIEEIRAMLAAWRIEDQKRQARGKPPRRRRWLFGTANRSNFARDLAKACDKAGVPVFSSHMLGRHSFATRILSEEGKSLAFLKSAGRWKSLKAVERYTHLSKNEVADEIKQMGAKWKAGRKEGKVLPLNKKG